MKDKSNSNKPRYNSIEEAIEKLNLIKDPATAYQSYKEIQEIKKKANESIEFFLDRDFNLKETIDQANDIVDTRSRIKYYLDRKADCKILNIKHKQRKEFIRFCESEIKKNKQVLEIDANSAPDVTSEPSNENSGFTNNQMVLIYHYFFDSINCGSRSDIDRIVIAKFIHLTMKKEFSTPQNSDIYEKLRKAPNASGDSKLSENLEVIRELFSAVKLDGVAKKIDEELELIKREKKRSKERK